MRLGVYADLVFRRDGTGISATASFVSWLVGLGTEVEELVIFGRVDPSPGRAEHEVTGPSVRFVELGYYGSLQHPRHVVRAALVSARRVQSELHGLDAILLFGPHPLAVLFGIRARHLGLPVIVGIRQDFIKYVAARVTGWKACWTKPAARILDLAHRGMARWGGAIAVSEELGRPYMRAGRPLLVTGISLVRRGQIGDRPSNGFQPWPGQYRALAVTRLEPEKNPLLLVDILVALRRDGPWTLAVAGSGSLEAELAERIHRAHLEDVFETLGHVDGYELGELYRRATVFIHVSWTEGQPQVLFEAAANGLPIVATAVGGVPNALGNGARGLLVPPGDARRAAMAVSRLDRDPLLRRAMVERAWEWAVRDTLDAQVCQVVRFVQVVIEREVTPRRHRRRTQGAGT